MLNIRELRVFDTDPKATAKLERNLRAMPELAGLTISRTTSSAEACKGADIVTTVTADKRNAVILTPPMIAPGMHLNAVGGDCPGKTELHPDLLRIAEPARVRRIRAAIAHRRRDSAMSADYPVTEFADLARGTAHARTDRSQVTVFDSVGFALEDYSALRFLHGLLQEERGAARQIDLVPQLDNPKDLYGGTLGHGARSRIPQERLIMANRVSLIGVPSDIGAGVRGASMGPEALRVAEIQSMLEAQGLEVIDRGDLRGPAQSIARAGRGISASRRGDTMESPSARCGTARARRSAHADLTRRRP